MKKHATGALGTVKVPANRRKSGLSASEYAALQTLRANIKRLEAKLEEETPLTLRLRYLKDELTATESLC